MSVYSSVLYMYVCLYKCLSVHMYTCQFVVCQYVHDVIGDVECTHVSLSIFFSLVCLS